jgi:hypothetical protein
MSERRPASLHALPLLLISTTFVFNLPSPLFCMSACADGKLTAAHMCAVVAALVPEDAIVVDESLTSSE